MNQIKCPNCKTAFELQQHSLNDILRQVKDEEYFKALEVAKSDALRLAKADFEKDKADLRSNFEKAFYEEKSKKESALKDKETAVKEALANAEKEKTQLLASIQSKNIESKAELDKLKYEHEIILKHKDEELERVKNYKQSLNVKMLGEALERYCETEFEKLRSTAFANAIFTKDNTAFKGEGDVTGSKGDYIFRDIDESGVEVVSIMFEMKTEEDTTATKKTNDSFLEKLNKDRINKKCEYAVLVSTLESDSDLYNGGIVDKSHKFEKMFVVRPQFFIPIISLLRNAGKTSIKDRRELATIKNEQIDLTNFEEQLHIFKDDFGRNYRLASDKFRKAIEDIDKSIKQLEKTKAELLGSENQLRIANDKVDDITIKKLTKHSPETRAKLEEIGKGKGK